MGRDQKNLCAPFCRFAWHAYHNTMCRLCDKNSTGADLGGVSMDGGTGIHPILIHVLPFWGKTGGVGAHHCVD